MKIPIKNLFYLLCYAWDVLDEADEVEVGTVEAPDLENLISSVLATHLHRLLRRGLERDYQERREDSKYLRGRIDFQETVKRMLSRRGEAHTISDDLSPDTLANRLIKASIASLLSFETLANNNREELAAMHHGLRDISPMRISPADFYRVRLHRNNREYRLLLSLCEMVHRYALPTEAGRGMRFVDFARAGMWKVFQQFVTNFYRRRQSIYTVNAHQFSWHDSFPMHSEKVALPWLATDIVLSNSEQRLVIDTKYVGEPFQQWHAKSILKPTHVNQVFAYMQNIAAKDKLNRPVDGMLLYAAVSGAFSLEWHFFGRGLKAVSLDLSKDWRDIESQLLSFLPASKHSCLA